MTNEFKGLDKSKHQGNANAQQTRDADKERSLTAPRPAETLLTREQIDAMDFSFSALDASAQKLQIPPGYPIDDRFVYRWCTAKELPIALGASPVFGMYAKCMTNDGRDIIEQPQATAGSTGEAANAERYWLCRKQKDLHERAQEAKIRPVQIKLREIETGKMLDSEGNPVEEITRHDAGGAIGTMRPTAATGITNYN